MNDPNFGPKLDEGIVQVEFVRKIPSDAMKSLERKIKNCDWDELVQKIALHPGKKWGKKFKS